MSFAAAEYRPSGHASRATFLSFILAGHAFAMTALLAIGGIAVLDHSNPLMVELLTEPRVTSPPPKWKLPMPELRAPEVRLPAPPPIENLFSVTMIERPSPAAPAPALAAAMTESAPVLEPPRADLAYLSNPPPRYPSASRRAREHGRVLLRVQVDASGTVGDIQVHATSGFPRLDEAALTAVRRWRFQPARLGDRAVAGVALVPIHFELG